MLSTYRALLSEVYWSLYRLTRVELKWQDIIARLERLRSEVSEIIAKEEERGQVEPELEHVMALLDNAQRTLLDNAQRSSMALALLGLRPYALSRIEDMAEVGTGRNATELDRELYKKAVAALRRADDELRAVGISL